MTSRPPWLAPDRLALLVHHFRHDARQRPRRRTRLGRDRAGQRRDHDHARLGLPPRIDDRTALLADLLVIPHPRFGVDRLADGAQQTQTRQVVLGRPLVAPLDEGADGGRRGVEDVDAILLDDLPEAVLARMVRRPLVHDASWRRCTAGRRRCSCGPSPSRRRPYTSRCLLRAGRTPICASSDTPSR